jgi:predicted nuclease of restriction endonuclease-like (RecB) superfamily
MAKRKSKAAAVGESPTNSAGLPLESREARPTATTFIDPHPHGYPELLENLKARIRSAQVRASLSINRELITLFWDIGRLIDERQRAEARGTSIVQRLAADLRQSFPGVAGFSSQNLWRMRAFYLAWADSNLSQVARDSSATILSQPARELQVEFPPAFVAVLPWFHNVTIVEQVKDPLERRWYAEQTTVHGWSRAVLAHQIETRLFHRSGQAITNFDKTLPTPDSDLARQILKDPYNFDFLTLAADAHERDLERGLVEHLKSFLLELGTGFAFVGQQYHLEVGGEDFYVDLLFYHLHLRRYVVIDLKAGAFQPEFAGKMNFYLSAADDLLRRGDDQASIGLILCRSHNRVVAEYALRDTAKPMGVATFGANLPPALRDSLPSPAALARALDEGTSLASGSPDRPE